MKPPGKEDFVGMTSLAMVDSTSPASDSTRLLLEVMYTTSLVHGFLKVRYTFSILTKEPSLVRKR